MLKYFKALVSIQNDDGTFASVVKERSMNELPDGDLLVRVEYSSLNYKDALSAYGVKGVTSKYPHTPGIDAAGIVEKSNNSKLPSGTRVIVTGFDLGMNTSGGFAEYISIPSEWAIRCPENLSTKEAMIIGTAGLTAGLAVQAINQICTMQNANIIISGSTGGVGCLGIQLCSLLKAKVTAITGKINKKDFLFNLGASKVIERNKFINSTKLPLSHGIYNAAIDTVGGDILSCIIASMKYNGLITSCGNARDSKFQTSVFPFILRANQLIGIDSAECPIEKKEIIWNNFASNWKLNRTNDICSIVGLDDIIPEIEKIYTGEQTGRILLKI